ncbi:MAG: hypothetical protein ABIT10_09295 [Alteraurantiacibacter sp.]
MSRMYGDDVELTDHDASLIKGMIARGDKNESIAAYFGVNQRAVSHVRSGQKFSDAKPAQPTQLPPPGPYGVDPIYASFYQTMVRVNEIWNGRELGRAKELLEKALNNPVFVHELEGVDEASATLFRDEFGLTKNFDVQQSQGESLGRGHSIACL